MKNGLEVTQIARIYRDDGSVRVEYTMVDTPREAHVFELTAEQWTIVSAPRRSVIVAGVLDEHRASDDGMPEPEPPDVYERPIVYVDARA